MDGKLQIIHTIVNEIDNIMVRGSLKAVIQLAKDPVCNMNVDEGKAKIKSSYGGKEYYFCGPGCKVSFDKNPAKYVKK